MRLIDPDAIGAAYEAGLGAAKRRAIGAHYTPRAVADGLAAIALDGLSDRAVVCDPACGAGAMLLAAGRALVARGAPRAKVAAEQLWGVDRDSAAIGAARAAIVAWSGVDPGQHLAVGDGLRAGERWHGRFDLVLGNPPFLNQLRSATVRTASVPDSLVSVVRPYTDTAWLFLAAAPGLVRRGGRIVLIQPQSVAAARDAGPVRDAVGGAAVLEGMWSSCEPIFGASVLVCAPVLRVGAHPPRSVRRWTGATLEEIDPVAPLLDGSWSPLLVGPDPPPPFALRATHGTIGAIATATAGFRDEFYGLAPHLVDERAANEATHPKLVTAGLVEPGRLVWGERQVRVAGRRYDAPRVELASLERGGSARLLRWVRARIVPKVLVATQTRVIEAAADVAGTTVPSTPVISVEGCDPWLVAAALTAPPVTAWAATYHAGKARNAGAIKLAARDVLDVALPGDAARWREGASLLAAGQLLAAAEVLNAAHGGDEEVLRWWARRARLT
ncbi:MAG: HsdM family class I SAM-dependent methyltransferase [Acidimicrobiales bacterium]